MQRRYYFTALLVFKALHGIGPNYISDMFTYIHEVNLVATRSAASNNLYVPRLKSIFEKSLMYNGAKIWNSLPAHLKHSTDPKSFNFLAKRHFS